MSSIYIFIVLIVFVVNAAAFLHPVIFYNPRSAPLSMGLGDFLKNALANDPNLPPAKNPGLSSTKETVDVEFLPSKIVVKAYLGQNLGLIAKAAKIDIKYKCKKGECGTCTVNFNGKLVKACQGSLPSISKEKKFQIGIISK